MPHDFSKSVIYRLTCENPDYQYYGATIQPLHKVLASIYAKYKKYYKLYENNLDSITFSVFNTTYDCRFQLFKIGGVEIESVLEVKDCESQYELNEILDTYIDNDFCVNPYRERTDPEKQAYNKLYYQANKKKILTQKKGYKQYYKNIFDTHKDEFVKQFNSRVKFINEKYLCHQSSFHFLACDILENTLNN